MIFNSTTCIVRKFATSVKYYLREFTHNINMILKGQKKRFIYTLILLFVCLLTLSAVRVVVAKAMPFYSLSPKFLTIRSSFSTYYENSSSERKSNILLATKSIDGYILDVGAEFSFNKIVGERTEKRGYKQAKIIVGGEFVDGVGGGVCQVSTTLYNAVVLSGLSVVEYHAHSLPVSYVPPSFDAMVNSGSSDLRFTNDTKNPIIIRASADGNKLTIKIIGEPLKVEYRLESKTISKIPAPEYIIVKDEKGEYPDLYEGERLYLSYSKDGIKSQGYIETYKDGKKISTRLLRRDTYSAVQGKVVVGSIVKPPLPTEN